MRAYIIFNKIQNSSLIAFFICSIILLISAVLQLIGLYAHGSTALLINDFSSAFIRIQPYVFCCFITQYNTTEKRFFKSFWSVLCLLILSTAYGDSVSFIGGIIVALFCSFFFERFNKYISLSVTIITALIFGLLLRNTAPFFTDFQMTAAYTISAKGIISTVLFAVINTALTVFDNNSFENLFFYKSYGGTLVSGNEVITGIKDLFESGYNGELISDYLTGHFFLLFALLGIALALSDELKSAQKICLITVTVCAVFSGNMSLLLLFLFFESWHIFFSAVLLSALSYLSASLLDIRVGYLLDGGIFEMILNINKPVYLIVGCLVFVAIGYFCAKYTSLKFGISDRLNVYIPTRLNRLVHSLGGIVNIIKINDDTVEVRNPKLVNNFEIDCEIRENIIKINDEKIKELKEYIE